MSVVVTAFAWLDVPGGEVYIGLIAGGGISH